MGPRTGLRVGLAWAGSPRNTRDVERSILFEHVLPLLCIAGVEWFSLQKGAQAADLARAPAGRIVDLSSRLSDFAETAAALAHIDLVITVCTAVAHLAGALGKPVWLMNGFVPDWRWLAGRSDSPWYPTMRLFAQSKAGDWETVAREVGAALQQEVATPR